MSAEIAGVPVERSEAAHRPVDQKCLTRGIKLAQGVEEGLTGAEDGRKGRDGGWIGASFSGNTY